MKQQMSDNASYMGEAISCRVAEGKPSISNDINNEKRREENPRILTPTVKTPLQSLRDMKKLTWKTKQKTENRPQ